MTTRPRLAARWSSAARLAAAVALAAGCGAVAGNGRAPADGRWDPAAAGADLEALRAGAEAGRATPAELAVLGILEEAVGRPSAALGRLVEAVEAGVDRTGDAGALEAAEAAAAQLAMLEGRAGGWREAIGGLARRIGGRPGSPRLTYAVQGLRVRDAFRSGGSTAELDEAVAAAGCLTRWRAVGPFGPFSLLSFDDVHAPAGPGPLQARYDLGPGRGRAAPFAPVVEGCDVTLDAPQPSWGGTTYAVTFVDLEAAGEVVLTLETASSARVFANDVQVLAVDRRREVHPPLVSLRLWLPAGRSELVVALTSRYPDPRLVATLTDAAGRPVIAGTAAASPAGHSPAAPRVLEAEAPPEPRTAAGWLLAASTALAEGRRERVRDLLDRGPAALRDGAPGLLLAAMSWAGDPTVPSDVARNRGLALLRRASELEPAAWRPYFELARHDADEDRADDAIRRVRAGLDQAPEQPALWLLLASLVAAQGLWAEGEEAIERAAELAPGSCEPLRARLGLALNRRRQAEARAAAQALAACDRSADALARALLAEERWGEAEAELRRLLALRGDDVLLLDGLDDALRGRGATDEEVRVLERRRAIDPEDRIALLDLVDLGVASGEAARAIEELGRAAALLPADNLLERRLQSLLSGTELLAPLRTDGRRAIAEFEASGASYDEPSVLVLDRTVFRVFPDGSVVELTQGVTRVQSDEGIEREGEFRLPQGAVLLAIRTIKADGTVLEPEEIEGKDTLSLPNLEVGDYVETAILRGIEPPPEFPGGVWPWRFYFEGLHQAFHHSELVVIAPAGLDLDLSWRGEPLPEERRTVGALQVRRWVARGQGTIVDEPDGPAADETVRSLLVSAGTSWGLYRQALAEALADRDRSSAELRETSRAALAEAGPGSDPLDALFRWVAEHVEGGGDPLGPVSHMVAARTGERTRLLAALARAAGLDARLGFARSSYGDQTDDPVPSPEVYAYPVLRVGSRWLFVGEDARWAPSCALPPDLRGQRVLMLDGEPLFESMPEEPSPPCAPDATRVVLRLAVAADGTAEGTVEEVLSGAEAIRWRALLGRTPPEERQGVLEQDHLADALPGAELPGLEIRGHDDPDGDLTLIYRVRAVQLAEAASGPGELRLALPYRSELTAGYASLPVRRTPLVIRAPVDATVRTELTLPAGAVVRAPADAEAIDPLGELRIDHRVGPSSIVVERRLRLHPGRVAPEAYAAFASFCQEVDRLEQQEISVRLALR